MKGRGQYAEIGNKQLECMGDLNKCPNGITVAAWMRFHGFENNMVFLSTGQNGILMAYKRGMMQVSVNGQGTVIIPTRWKSIHI